MRVVYSDTITAISTPLGEGGIGIVRLSGKDAFSIVKKVFKTKNKELKSHKLIYGKIVNPEDEKIVDEVLVSFMSAPHTYTREDIVEINCHGGIVPLRKILELCLKQGARMAERGEFTQRAFLNGRIDLTQAEAVMDIIRAKTDAGREIAVSQIEGKLYDKIKDIKEKIVGLLALVEVNLDFPEEDIEEVTVEKIKKSTKDIVAEIEEILETADDGIIFREGLKTTIIGKPNVGKSSLLNALLKEQRAIVTEIPGTTRDILEEVISIRGVPLRVIDTAGIRKTKDVVEKIGVERAEKAVRESDLVLFIVDAKVGIEEEDRTIMEMLKNKKSIFIINKIDLVDSEKVEEIIKKIDKRPVIKASFKYGSGLKKLEESILNLVFKGEITPAESILINNSRQKGSLEKAKKNISEALQGMEEEIPLDLITIDLRRGWEFLGEITGEALEEGILNKIFSEFCIGK